MKGGGIAGIWEGEYRVIIILRSGICVLGGGGVGWYMCTWGRGWSGICVLGGGGWGGIKIVYSMCVLWGGWNYK